MMCGLLAKHAYELRLAELARLFRVAHRPNAAQYFIVERGHAFGHHRPQLLA